MQKFWLVAVALIAAVVMVGGPASAVSVGPSGEGVVFDSTGLVGPDAPRATVDVAGVGRCYLDKSSCQLPKLTVGRTYRAVVSDAGEGSYDCAPVGDDIACDWNFPDSTRREYVFTYSGQAGQKLEPYFAPARVTISRTKAPLEHGWVVSCAVTRAGVPAAGTPVRVQYRAVGTSRWHSPLDRTAMPKVWKTDAHGQVRLTVGRSSRRAAVRCVTNGDWHTEAAASRVVRLPSR